MHGQQEPLGIPPIGQAFRTVLMSTAAFSSWGDQVGKVCGGSVPSDALCGCLRQTGVAALQSLSERSHHMALCPGCSTSLSYLAGGHPLYRSTFRCPSPHLSRLYAAGIRRQARSSMSDAEDSWRTFACCKISELAVLLFEEEVLLVALGSQA